MYNYSFFRPHHKAWGISLLIHLVILLLLLYAIRDDLVPRQQPVAGAKEDKPTEVIFAPEAEETSIPKPQARQATQQEEIEPRNQQIPEKAPEHEAPVVEQEPESVPSRAYQIPTQERRTRSRNSWRKAPAEQQEQAPSMAQSINQALAYQTPLFDEQATSDKQLGQKISAGFVEDAGEMYQFLVARAICYELNKQHIAEAPANLPQTLVMRLSVNRDGNLVSAQILQGSKNESFNQKILESIRLAAPFRKAPTQLQHLFKDNKVTFTFTVHPSDGFLSDRNSSQPSPITFFMPNHPSAQARY